MKPGSLACILARLEGELGHTKEKLRKAESNSREREQELEVELEAAAAARIALANLQSELSKVLAEPAGGSSATNCEKALEANLAAMEQMAAGWQTRYAAEQERVKTLREEVKVLRAELDDVTVLLHSSNLLLDKGATVRMELEHQLERVTSSERQLRAELEACKSQCAWLERQQLEDADGDASKLPAPLARAERLGQGAGNAEGTSRQSERMDGQPALEETIKQTKQSMPASARALEEVLFKGRAKSPPPQLKSFATPDTDPVLKEHYESIRAKFGTVRIAHLAAFAKGLGLEETEEQYISSDFLLAAACAISFSLHLQVRKPSAA